MRKLAEIGEVAKAKFTHELHDKLDKLEREIIKELTKGSKKETGHGPAFFVSPAHRQ